MLTRLRKWWRDSELVGLALHRFPRDGDKIRLYDRVDTGWVLRGDDVVEIEGRGKYAAIRLVHGNPAEAIRRDLPQWCEGLGMWVYNYEA